MKIKIVYFICMVLVFAIQFPVFSAGLLTTALTPADLDAVGFTQYFDGAEQSLGVVDGPTHVVWTTTTAPQWDGVKFGASKNPGARYMRIGFNTPILTGSVLVRGGGTVSVLRPDAVYPGNMSDDKQWIPAQRINSGKVVSTEVVNEGYSVWVLPANTLTRAIRFTHTAVLTDATFNGWLGGIYLLSNRVANIAPQAIAGVSASIDNSVKINNESNDGTWSAWDNNATGNATIISTGNPEWVMLVWSKAITLAGLNALWAGFATAEVQYFTGPADLHPREATDADWKTIKIFDKVDNQYPRALGVNWMEFDTSVTTRAIRLKLTKVTTESHPHLINRTCGGKRVWLGELLALQSLNSAALDTAIIPATTTTSSLHPPIPIRFNLAEDGIVSLVIEDATGKRIRNLVSETPYAAGNNIAWWDCMDDLGRDTEAASHGVYNTPGKFVSPGTYRVRGITHKTIDLSYEFSLYNGGSPAWLTADSTGGWLANHTPPSSALFVPGNEAPGGKPLVFLGSYISEGPPGLAWVDLDGRKVGGRVWVGGNWTGAPFLARDAGPKAIAGQYAYVGSAFDLELRLTALTAAADKQVITYTFASKDLAVLNGIAVYNGLMVCSLPQLKQLLLIDVSAGKELGTTTITDTRGVAFDAQGRLLVLVGNTLQRYTVPAMTANMTLTAPQTIISTGLDDPRHITLDSKGNIYIANAGVSHQVKVFASDGSFLRNIGVAGAPKAGPYDPLHMNNPNGMAIDEKDQLWVTENDFQPKRVSVWGLDGKFIKAFYGPAEYGGGGNIDSTDKNKFYYHGMQFKLDWVKGTDTLESVYYRPAAGDLTLPDIGQSGGYPETPIYLNGKRYFTNCYNSCPTNGTGITIIWVDKNGIAIPAAAMGRANDWSVLAGDTFKPNWPAGVDLKGDYWQNQASFVWTDANDDGQMQVSEVSFKKISSGGMTVMPDLSILCSRYDVNTVRFAPVKYTTGGAPYYNVDAGEILAKDVSGPTSSGGDQTLVDGKGWTVLTVAPKPYAPQSLCGVNKDGKSSWSYPSLWPGLHASHESPAPDRLGELIGTTRLLGGIFTPRKGDAGPMWAVNGNMGNMYLFTSDGLFVSTIFRDVRVGHSWTMPVAQRGMLLNDISCSDENFWPSITQTPDGNIYVMDGNRVSIVRVDGLDSIVRLPNSDITITSSDIAKCQDYFQQLELERQKTQGLGLLKVSMMDIAPVVDGALADWQGVEWVTVDKRGVAAYFNSNSKPYDVSGAVAISGNRLYVAIRNADLDLLTNSGTMPIAPFKTGGAIDIMIGTNPRADEKRTNPVEGDLRLLVTIVNGKPLAMLYRPVVPGTKVPVPFSSPWRTITIDRVDDVSANLLLSTDNNGNYEFSIPFDTLGLQVQPGMLIKGDIGLLRGNGFQTLQRVYWANKATGITADVPSEAMLTPLLWGKWQFEKWSYTPQSMPVLISPANNAFDIPTSPTLTWKPDAVATVYSVEVATDSTFYDRIISDQTVTTTSYNLSNLLTNTKYYWRIKCGDGTLWGTPGTAVFTTITRIGTPTLTTPINAAANIPISTTLSWQAVANAVNYTVEYATNTNFTDAQSATGPFLTTDVALISNSRYFWRVKAADVNSSNSNWSSVWYFSTVNTVVALTTPVLISPATNALGVPVNATFTWSSVANASAYDFEISSNSKIVASLSISSARTSVSLSATLANNTVYSWRVRAKNGINIGAWSPTNTFTSAAFAPITGVDAAISKSRTVIPLVGVGIVNTDGSQQSVQINQPLNRQSEFCIIIKNTGNVSDNFLITSATVVGKNWKVGIFDISGTDCTQKLFNGGWLTGILKPGESLRCFVRLVAYSGISISNGIPQSQTLNITAKSWKDYANKVTTPASDTVIAISVLTGMSKL